MAYSISPITAMGGVSGKRSLTELVSSENAIHSTWVERLRLATDFITSDNTLICVADHWLHENVENVTPIGITQSFSYNEALAATLAPEIGSRRKRAMVGSSQGGTISIAKMLCMGDSPMKVIAQAGSAMGINADHWTEKEWLALVGLNHDKLRTPQGIVVIEGAPDGRNYSAYMFEQCLLQGQSRGHQAGQHLVVDNFNMIFEQVVPIWSDTTEEDVDYGSTI